MLRLSPNLGFRFRNKRLVVDSGTGDSSSMAFLQSPTSSLCCSVPFPPPIHVSQNFVIMSRKPFDPPRKSSVFVVSCSPPQALPTNEEELLAAVALSDGEKDRSLPAVRSYENDLSRLTLIGDVAFEQALTAAAADGGEAADEHISSGMSTMVVETVFPGASDEHSTVSTRLFLPSKKVKEKASKLRSTLTAEMLSSSTSRNILAITFRQVVLQKLWSFELALFIPGTERNMGELENPREVPTFFTLSSSDERVLSVLAEVLCKSALDSTKKDLLDSSPDETSNNIFGWFQRSKMIASSDSSVFIYKLHQDEIVENAKNLLENFNTKNYNYRPREMKKKHHWWTTSAYLKLEKIGGPEFGFWAREYIPAYRLQIDADKLENVKFKGWRKSAENRWEVLLTHFQMVELANILDMYFEDIYTLPYKQLLCGVVADLSVFSRNKSSTSLWKTLFITLVSGFVLVSISVMGQIFWSRLFKVRNFPAKNCSLASSEIDWYQSRCVEASKLEDCCISVVRKIKDAFGWPGEIVTERDFGAWTGELPNYLRRLDNQVNSGGGEDIQNYLFPTEKSSNDVKTSAQNIASYQVVLTCDGKIIGFQPMSRVAVNHWAANPLSKELYGGRKLSPGLIEPRLKISQPEMIVVIELLMSVNPESRFALARPVR